MASGLCQPKAALSGMVADPQNLSMLAGAGKVYQATYMHYTYVLLCEDDHRKELYIGSSEDLKNRFNEHKNGEVKTTKSFDNLTLVYYEACLNKADARKRELQLKTGFGRGYLKKRLESNLKEK